MHTFVKFYSKRRDTLIASTFFLLSNRYIYENIGDISFLAHKHTSSFYKHVKTEKAKTLQNEFCVKYKMYDNSNSVLLSLYNMMNVLDKSINIRYIRSIPILHLYYNMVIEYSS